MSLTKIVENVLKTLIGTVDLFVSILLVLKILKVRFYKIFTIVKNGVAQIRIEQFKISCI